MNQIIFGKLTEYCERNGQSFFDEPFNAFSNIAYFAAAFFLFQFVRQNQVNKILGYILVGIIFSLGVGSFLWHSYRTTWTQAMDEYSIYAFVFVMIFFLIQSLTQKIKTSSFYFIAIGIIYLLLFTIFPEINVFSGLSKYIFVMLVFALLNYLIIRKHGNQFSFTIPLLLFLVAIILRGLDLVVCKEFPMGTHFLWHIGIGGVIYLSSKKLLILELKNH